MIKIYIDVDDIDGTREYKARGQSTLSFDDAIKVVDKFIDGLPKKVYE